MVNRITRSLLCTLPLLALVAAARGQVMIAPTLIYMGSQQPFGTFMVINQAAKPQEVSLEFRFGYPTSDVQGNRSLTYDDSTAAAAYALNDWIRCFPRKFVLAPGARQVVRLMVRPPAGLGDGVYWTRLVTTSADKITLADQVGSQLSGRVNVVLKQAIPVLYKSGRPTTRILLKHARAQVEDQHVRITADLEREGDAPFLGSAVLKVFDEKGKLVEEQRKDSEVYFRYSEQMTVARSKLAPGRYAAELTLFSERKDIPARQLPAMTPVATRLSFEIPSH